MVEYLAVKMQEELRAGKAHIRFCLEIYGMQFKGRRHFVHEHPEKSKAWDMPEMKKFMMKPEVGAVVLQMCAFGICRRHTSCDGRKRNVLQPLARAEFIR